MAFINTGQPNNEANIVIGALAGTHIHWLKMRDNERISSSRSMNGYARFRDIRQAPDGNIYALTESPNRFVQLRSNVPILSLNKNEELKSVVKDYLYPNPGVGETNLSFSVNQNQMVSVSIYNANGCLIKKIPSEFYTEGDYTLTIDLNEFPLGFYFVEIDKKDGLKKFLKFIKM